MPNVKINPSMLTWQTFYAPATNIGLPLSVRPCVRTHLVRSVTLEPMKHVNDIG